MSLSGPVSEIRRLWRGPAVAAVLVLGLTVLVALVQQGEAERRRDLLFESQTDQLQHELTQAIDRQGERFLTGMDFVAVTHPGPAEEFRRFFRRQDGADRDTGATEPDFILVEEVAAADLAALERREARLGTADWDLRILSDAERRWIITRTGSAVPAGRLSLVGLDVTRFRSVVSPEEVEGRPFTIRVFEADPAVDLMVRMSNGDEDEVAAEARTFSESTFALIGSVTDGGTGEVLGTAVRFVPIDQLLKGIDQARFEDLRASLQVEGFDGPVAELNGYSPGHADDGDLVRTVELGTSGQGWQLSVSGTDSFGPATALLAPTATWFIGAMASVLSALLVGWRAWHRQRLMLAELELARARAVASTDGLTGLLNRVGFVQAIAGLDSTAPAGLLFIDLDGFKSVNDLDGHQAGDLVLQEVAERLRKIVRSGDLVSRLGGDEFILYLDDVDDEAILVDLADRAIAAIDAVDPRLSCSIGIAVRAAGQASAVDDLVRRADRAMYRVKRSGGRGFEIVDGGGDFDEIPTGSSPILK